jgi:dTDP-4-dehydrorhamnose reductase
VNDQIGSPTYAFDLAQAIFKIISSDIEAAGIFNFSNNGVISWFEFAQAIKDINGYTCIVNPIPSSDYPVPAKRPRFSILNTKKIQDTFGVDVPNWNDSLKQCLKLLN